jgi:hypothetical protein
VADVNLDPRAIAEYIDDPDGPFAQWLENEVGPLMVRQAQLQVRRRTGTLKRSIKSRLGWNAGGIYLEVASRWYGVFLQPVHIWKSEQMHARYPYFDDLGDVLAPTKVGL